MSFINRSFLCHIVPCMNMTFNKQQRDFRLKLTHRTKYTVGMGIDWVPVRHLVPSPTPNVERGRRYLW